MRNAAAAAANMTRCIAGFSRSNTRCNKQTQEKDDLETDRSFFVPGQIYSRGIQANADKISSKNFVEIANTLQRFRFLRSVVYRSGFGGLQSKKGCGILRQRSSRSSGNQDFYRSPSEGLPPEEGKRNNKRSFRTHCARQRKVRRAAERSAYETLNT